jgi:hypothetical protein
MRMPGGIGIAPMRQRDRAAIKNDPQRLDYDSNALQFGYHKILLDSNVEINVAYRSVAYNSECMNTYAMNCVKLYSPVVSTGGVT